MFVVDNTRALLAFSLLFFSISLFCLNNYINNYCVLLLTGESFTISNCKINQDLVDLIREQRDFLNCH
nr:triple gene block protein 3 [Cowpea mild mottle virus]